MCEMPESSERLLEKSGTVMNIKYGSYKFEDIIKEYIVDKYKRTGNKESLKFGISFICDKDGVFFYADSFGHRYKIYQIKDVVYFTVYQYGELFEHFVMKDNGETVLKFNNNVSGELYTTLNDRQRREFMDLLGGVSEQ